MTTQAAANRFCSRCGAALQPSAAFCAACGTPIVVSAPPAEGPPTPVHTTVAQRRKRSPLGWGLVGLVGVGIALAIAHGDFTNGINSTAALLINATGVHVCSKPHFDRANVQCTHDDGRIGDLSRAYLQFYGPGGNSFRSNTATIQVMHQDGSAWRDDGQYTDNSMSRSFNTVANTLAAYFNSASVVPTHGQHYRVEVDDPQGLLGTAEFTYTGQ